MILCSGRSAATELLYASPYTPNHPFSRADATWMQWVNQQSQGRVHVRAIWSGGLISSDQSMIELRHGVADIGFITPVFTRGGAHLLRVQTGFYSGARTFEQQVAMYRCLAAHWPQFGIELAGLKVLAVQGGALPGLLTRSRVIHTLDDLRGLRVRVPSELIDVMRDLGADPVTMPMGDVYSNLAKGVIDGVVAPADTMKSLHFSEVAQHYAQLEVPRGAYPARAMSAKRWAALATEDQALLMAATSVWEAALSKETQAAVKAAEAETREHGVEFTPAAPAEQRRFDQIYDQDAARDARGLERFGIDGMAVFRDARRIADGIKRSGAVTCSSS